MSLFLALCSLFFSLWNDLYVARKNKRDKQRKKQSGHTVQVSLNQDNLKAIPMQIYTQIKIADIIYMSASLVIIYFILRSIMKSRKAQQKICHPRLYVQNIRGRYKQFAVWLQEPITLSDKGILILQVFNAIRVQDIIKKFIFYREDVD